MIPNDVDRIAGYISVKSFEVRIEADELLYRKEGLSPHQVRVLLQNLKDKIQRMLDSTEYKELKGLTR